MERKFSERFGYIESIQSIQIESMNDSLRNSLWNYIYSLYENEFKYWIRVARNIAEFFRKVPIDEIPYDNYECMLWIKKYYKSMKWYEVYDFIEFIAINHKRLIEYTSDNLQTLSIYFNNIFERELSGYRFISGIIAPISNSIEVEEISDTIGNAGKLGLQGTYLHLQTALKLLGKRPEPDYRNSIKESISAVESISKQLTGSSAQGLSGALDELACKIELHGALKAGFIKLYGYTSDESGIRHAILDQRDIGFSEAKYMLVSCSAFVNFLMSKAQLS